MRISDWSSDVCSSDLDRATNPRSKDFYRYGAAGIGFAERWLVFENFLEDMGERPEGQSLDRIDGRSEEHTSELQSLMRISYAVFCLKKKKVRTKYSKRNTTQYAIYKRKHKEQR